MQMIFEKDFLISKLKTIEEMFIRDIVIYVTKTPRNSQPVVISRRGLGAEPLFLNV